jgi:hypothetical protein
VYKQARSKQFINTYTKKMSEFQNSSSLAVPNDGSMNHRMTEISPDGNALSGDMRWRFTTSANHYWTPGSSYVILKFSITKAADAAIAAADATVLSADFGASAWSTVSHQINGQMCGQTSNPAQDSVLYKRLFMKRGFRDTLGGGLFYTSETVFTGSEATVLWVPPLGLYNIAGSVGGQSQHVLNATLHNDLAHRLVAQSSLARSSINVRLMSAKLMMATVMPMSVLRPPKTLVIRTLDLNTNSQTVNSNGSSTLSYTVPPSTRRIIISSQIADLRADSSRGATFLGGAPLDNMHVDYAPQQVPQLPYTGSADTLRKYADLYGQSLLRGDSVYDSIVEYAQAPITGHLFSKSPEDVSTSAVVRFTCSTASTTPSNVFCTALHYNSIVLQHDSSGVTTGVSYMTVN